MRKRFLFLTGILLLVLSNGYTQDLPTIKPPPPAAMQFQKYGDYPVSHFTGVPDISIPLYTIKEGDLEVPITLSAHVSGFKPSDVDGVAGYGWVLNVGGQVARTVYDNEDENTPSNVSTVALPKPTASFVDSIRALPRTAPPAEEPYLNLKQTGMMEWMAPCRLVTTWCRLTPP